MLYDPADLDSYAPLWSWDAGSYAYLLGAGSCSPQVQQLYVPGAVHARSSWVTVEIRPCTAPAFVEAQRADLARIKRLDLRDGIPPWRLWDLAVTESHIGALANKGRLSRRHGNLASAILEWPNDPIVRAACDNQTSLTTIAENGSEFLVELPDLPDTPELVGNVLFALEEMLGARAFQWDGTSAFQSTYEGITLAFREGNMQPRGRSLHIRVPLGEPELLRPPNNPRWLQREMQGLAHTKVRLGPQPGMLRMEVVPPGTELEIRLFNEHLGLSPVHLLSWEMLRVVNTLRCVRRWVDACPVVDLWPTSTRLANLVEDLVLRAQFVCVDAAAECFRPHPPLWRSNHEHGRDSKCQALEPS